MRTDPYVTDPFLTTSDRIGLMDGVGMHTGSTGIEVMKPQRVAHISSECETETGELGAPAVIIGRIGEIDQNGVDAGMIMEAIELAPTVGFRGITLVVVRVEEVTGEVAHDLKGLVGGRVGAGEPGDLVEDESDVGIVRGQPAGETAAVGGFGFIVFDFRKAHAFPKRRGSETTTQMGGEQGGDEPGRNVTVDGTEVVVMRRTQIGEGKKQEEENEHEDDKEESHLEIERENHFMDSS